MTNTFAVHLGGGLTSTHPARLYSEHPAGLRSTRHRAAFAFRSMRSSFRTASRISPTSCRMTKPARRSGWLGVSLRTW